MGLRRVPSLQARSAAANSLSASDLGTKVSLLFRIDDPEHPFSEAVGFLQRIDESDEGPVYVVAKKSGDVVAVPAAHILRLKRVPSR